MAVNLRQRPNLPENLESSSSIYFMQMNTDYYIETNSDRWTPIIRIFGVTIEGYSVLAHVHRYEPYFWFECPEGWDTEEEADLLKNILNQPKPQVKRIEIHPKQSIMQFSLKGDINFFKIITFLPKFVANLKSILEIGIKIGSTTISGCTYESNIPYSLRFMIDKDITGMSWIELKPEYTFKLVKTSHCQIELDIHYYNVIPHPPEGEWSKIPPLRILSFDIESNNNGDSFPTPIKDEVIQIGNICKITNSDIVLEKSIFTLGGCSDIAGARVFSFDDERELLLAWKNFIIEIDPDIITGYNILNFDLTYLIDRATFLGVESFSYLGRIKSTRSIIKEIEYESKAQGIRNIKEINIEGRVQLDMFLHISKEHKLSRYSLNSVSMYFLKEQKEDVHYSEINGLQNGDNDTRRRIAVYCLKDCYLPLRLLEKLMCIYNYTEMARVTGVSMSHLVSRGQQIKVTSELLRKAKEFNMVIPTRSRSSLGDKYKGAFVLEPVKGFYNTPIATLDFASLYPSIMMAHNLCYCTLIPHSLLPKLDPESYTETPNGEFFIKSHIRKGILPLILEEILAARKKAKIELSQTSDPFMQKVLDGRQLALKISANSVYGFTGAEVGQLPCLEISSSVTSYGREMIEAVCNKVLSHYSKRNGYDFDSEVIYGDTDSVMIKFGNPELDYVMDLSREAAEIVSEDFADPIKLEFEKVYYPYLLLNKKKYAGLLWTSKENYDKIDIKGIESVRRDNCSLVRQTINTVLDELLIHRNVEGAVKYVKEVVSALLQNQIDLSLLVITKAIGKTTEKSTGAKKKTYSKKQAHVELAEKLRERDSANAPNVGDRIAYVMIKGSKSQKSYELSEDPIYALENNLPIDYDWYLEREIKKPLSRIFEAILPNPNILFTGEHTRKRFQTKITSGALLEFMKVAVSCLSCKTPIKDGFLCKKCLEKAPDIYLEKTLVSNELERSFQELWSECERCEGSICEEVLCTNRDCPIFYRREKMKKDIEDVRQDLDKFHLIW